MALRLTQQPCAAKYGGAWARSGLEEEGEKAGPCMCAVEEFAAESGRKSGNSSAEVIIAAAVTVVMGVGNRVLYKLTLVPLKNYPFLLGQLATFGGSGAAHLLKEAGIFWSLLMIVSFLFQAVDTILNVVVYFNDCCIR